MDNAQKAIMIGVGLFITIIIIAAVMAITGVGTNLLNQGQSQLGGLDAQLQQSLTMEYDNKNVTGANVLAAIQKYYNDPNMVVAVKNSTNFVFSTPRMVTFNNLPTATVGGTTNTATKDTTPSPRVALEQFSNTNASPDNRVVTTGQYGAQLIKNNEVVVGISFVKK